MAHKKEKGSVPEIQIPIEVIEDEVEHINNLGHCIYKVPWMLRKVNEDAYTPHLISIGPMHYNNPKLKPMEEHKILYLCHFRRRVKDDEVLKDFMKYLVDNEKDIRNCYSEKFPSKEYPFLEEDEFVRMIFRDAAFIMELFLRKLEKKDHRRKAGGQAEKEDDSGKDENVDESRKAEKKYCIFDKSWLCKVIERDLLLAENQLPFSVLEELYWNLNIHGPKTFLELACNFFRDYYPGPGESTEHIIDHLGKDCKYHPKHFTDLIRSFYISKDLPCDENLVEYDNVKDATKLRNAGITFEPAGKKKHKWITCKPESTDIKGLLDVRFKKEEFLNWLPFLSCIPRLDIVKARLQIPTLTVDDSTEYVLRNLMAFEQCHYPKKNYICSYASFIDMLIGQENDAAVLLEQGIFTNELSSEKELTTMINKLCRNIVINSHCFGDTPKKLNDHYKNRWNKIVADLRLVYFSNLWKGTGTVVAFLVLVMSIFNFIRSNIEYF